MARVARSVTHSRRGNRIPRCGHQVLQLGPVRQDLVSRSGRPLLSAPRLCCAGVCARECCSSLGPAVVTRLAPPLYSLSLSHTSAFVSVSLQTEPALSSSSQRPASAALLSANSSSSSRERRPSLVTSTLSLLPINLEGKEEGLGRQHSGDTI